VNRISNCVAAFAMLAGSMLASAATTETLQYQGSLMTGSQTTWSGQNPVGAPATGTFTAFLDLSDSSNGWSIGSWGVDLNGTEVLSSSTDLGMPYPDFRFDEASGSVVGATISWSDEGYGPDPSPTQFSVGGNSGDSFSSYSNCNFPTSFSRCGLTLSNSTQGTWTVTSAAAPEVDPANAGSALTLLAGLAAIMRARRRLAA
jgi:hypothetical protein